MRGRAHEDDDNTWISAKKTSPAIINVALPPSLSPSLSLLFLSSVYKQIGVALQCADNHHSRCLAKSRSLSHEMIASLTVHKYPSPTYIFPFFFQSFLAGAVSSFERTMQPSLLLTRHSPIFKKKMHGKLMCITTFYVILLCFLCASFVYFSLSVSMDVEQPFPFVFLPRTQKNRTNRSFS